MTQRELERAVAQATGESVRTIAERGFGPLWDPPEPREPRTVDWDEVDAARNLALTPRRRRPAVSS